MRKRGRKENEKRKLERKNRKRGERKESERNEMKEKHFFRDGMMKKIQKYVSSR